jgi:hypothetical protein
MAKRTLRYEGPQALVVDLEREVSHGDEIEVDEALASRLLASQGFHEAQAAPKAAKHESHGEGE